MKRLLVAIALTAALTTACGSQAATKAPDGHEGHSHEEEHLGENEEKIVTPCSELPDDPNCPVGGTRVRYILRSTTTTVAP